MKKYLSIFTVATLIVPSVAFASWWNPTSWSVFSFIFQPTPQEQMVIVATPSSQNIVSSSSVTDTITTTTSLSKPIIQTPNVRHKRPAQTIFISNASTSISANSQPATTTQISPTAVSAITTISNNISTKTSSSTPYKGGDGAWYYSNSNGSITKAIVPSCNSEDEVYYKTNHFTNQGYFECAESQQEIQKEATKTALNQTCSQESSVMNDIENKYSANYSSGQMNTLINTQNLMKNQGCDQIPSISGCYAGNCGG